MSEYKKKFIEEQFLTKEVSKFELSFYEEMSGEEFLNNDLFKLLRTFSKMNTFKMIPLFLNREYLFWIDSYGVVSIHRIKVSKWSLTNEQYIFLCKVNEDILDFNEKKMIEEFAQKINELNIEFVRPQKEIVFFPVNMLYVQPVKIGF